MKSCWERDFGEFAFEGGGGGEEGFDLGLGRVEAGLQLDDFRTGGFQLVPLPFHGDGGGGGSGSSRGTPPPPLTVVQHAIPPILPQHPCKGLIQLMHVHVALTVSSSNTTAIPHTRRLARLRELRQPLYRLA